jgi:2,3-bisphosphoglycerate-independent phosphoglycerate mutase|tara:strand:- start:2721 stop:4019 length:1299 start_codon:yes stop_codon:yes gene_type:complete
MITETAELKILSKYYEKAYEMGKTSRICLKYILVVGDGMSDVALIDLGSKTPLQVARHPHMDLIASNGLTGLLKTIPPGSIPGTDTAFLSIFGCDPSRLDTGRGPLEAAGLGVDLNKNDLALRCNLVTVINGVLTDHSGGHISTIEARDMLESLKDHFEESGFIEFYPGVGYRHLLVLRGATHSDRILCTPPHDAINTTVNSILVKAVHEMGASTAEMLNKIIMDSYKLLKNHPVNFARIRSGKNPANMMWPWGQGRRPNIQSFEKKFGIRGAVISAVDIVNGIGRYLKMDLVKVPGVTGYYDTNYEGKADYLLKSLNDHDFVLVHIEAPDEASHVGDSQLKVKTIEDIDNRLLGRILDGLTEDYTIAILPDHTTQTTDGAHSRSPVPFALYSDKGGEGDKVKRYDEESVKEGSLGIVEGNRFLNLFLKQSG